MIHAKVLTVDGVLALVGSPNFNHRSMKQDDELCLVVPDPEITARLDADFEQDLAYAERLTEKSWEQRGLLRRVGERVSQLVKPQA